MNENAAGKRGQPLIFLFCLVGGWAMLRLAVWENPWPQQLIPDWASPAGEQLAASFETDPSPAHREGSSARVIAATTEFDHQPRNTFANAAQELADAGAISREFAAGRSVTGHNLLWMSAMARLPMPNAVAVLLDERDQAGLQPHDGREESNREKRWRFDGWLQLRGGSSAAPVGGIRPASYGSSQIGAVLAYDLAPASAYRPAVYLRASSALEEPRESDIAVGLRARPISGVPVTVHAELRATDGPSGLQLRPAAFAVAGFEDRDLPLGLGARGYVQAGYVGGDFATGFADGHLVVDHPVANFDLGDVRAGAGAWGGAQDGAERFDVGPTASVELQLGEVPARVAVDYRIRVAGDAQPENGPALTLSAGF